jgi:hypothetical protein
MQEPASQILALLAAFVILLSGTTVAHSAVTAFSEFSNDGGAGIVVRGSGEQPRLFFACCDQGVAAMQSLFANPGVIADLKDLHASLALAVPDLSAERAQIVHQLNATGIPLVAWIELPNEQGIYLNADDASQAAAAFENFEKWTAQYGLRWQGVGLDIEPNLNQLVSLKGHEWRLAGLLAARYFDRARVYRAREAYGRLILQLQLRGYVVQTYQMPLVVADRRAHTTLTERLLGIVDVRGNEEVLMLYSSFVPNLGAGLVWSFGPEAQAIAIGNTQADPSAGARGIPLNWEEFSRDLIVASHFSPIVGVYNLEGCVRQAFLGPLKTMNWSQSVLIPADSIRQANKMRGVISTLLWIGTLLPIIVAALLLLLTGLVWRRRNGRKRGKSTLSEVS